MCMLRSLKSAANDESGAVTVDWVVLTAATAGLAVALSASMEASISNVADEFHTMITQTVQENAAGEN